MRRWARFGRNVAGFACAVFVHAGVPAIGAPGSAGAEVASARQGAPLSSSAAAESIAVANRLLEGFDVALDREGPAQGVERAQRALRIREAILPKGDPDIARAQSALGRARSENGDYSEAASLLLQAIVVLESPAVRDSEALGSALNALGRNYTSMGDLDAAEAPLRRALSIRDAHHGQQSPQVRITLNNLANVFSGRGKLEEARPIYERLVAFEEAAQPPDSGRLAINLNNLANVVSDLGDYTRGKSLYERALAIRERLYGPKHLRVSSTLNNLASLAEVMKDDSLALSYMDRAIEIRRAALGERHPLTAEWITTRASIMSRLGRSQAAFDEALRGERLSREHLRLTAQTLSASQALAYERFRISGLHVAMNEVAMHGDSAMTRQAYDVLIGSRSMMLDELGERRRAGRDSSLNPLRAEWVAAQQRFSDLAAQGVRRAISDSSYKKRVEAARSEAESAELRYARRQAASRPGPSDTTLDAEAILRALPEHAAMVSFIRHSTPEVDPSGAGPPHYLAIVATAHHGLVSVALGPAARIDTLVAHWRHAVAVCPSDHDEALIAEKSYRSVAAELRKAVWDPLAGALRGAETVFIVPDGSLNFVNIATLPTPRGYIADDGPLLHVLSTERDLLKAARIGEARTLLAFGGVDYEHASPADLVASESNSGTPTETYRGVAPTCDEFRKQKFAFLVRSLPECEDVSSLWRAAGSGRSVTIHSGVAASENALKREAGNYDVLHVATHGFFLEGQCPDEDEELAANPLLHCGLIMSGADVSRPDPGVDDGLLTAEEIATLDLSRVRLVVLSACGTGLGQVVDGEGVFGLRRAFEIAGAGTLVMSLWDIGEVSTREWMRFFYDAGLRSHLPPPEAVRVASRKMLALLRERREATHPARWGALISCGDWR